MFLKRQVMEGISIVITLFETKSRSSRPEVFCKEGVLKNFAKFTGKQPESWHRFFPKNFAKF